MDFFQVKLSKSEWDSIEIQDSVDELSVYQLIKDGYHDVNVIKNSTKSLLQYMKINCSSEMHAHTYDMYFKPHVNEMLEAFGLTIAVTENMKSKKVKKADLYRIDNTTCNLDDQKNKVYEFILLGLILNMLNNKYPNRYLHWKTNLQNASESKKKKVIPPAPVPSRPKWMYYYYSICLLSKNNIENVNPHVNEFLNGVLKLVESDFNVSEFISRGHEYIEKNEYVFKCGDQKLYEHQKQIFTVFKTNTTPKLVLYIAPTGTGKTLTPIGLSEKYRIIFVCAARHVGLAFAKSCISIKKRVAFAFGCGSVDDIRLHFFAAKDYSINKKSGGIKKVDNSVGDNVEIMISDVKSYKYAMYYMNAFNELKNMILYWDEPTITLDYSDHPFHSIIKSNWSENIIPNVVLSSATLPQQNEMTQTIMDFQVRFLNANIYNIVSHDCQKTITLVDKNGYVQLPHLMFESHADVVKSARHCYEYKTLLRYMNLKEIIDFITHINNNKLWKSERYSLESNFADASEINMASLKLYYLTLIQNIPSAKWETIYNHFQSKREPLYKSVINFASSDAFTLTNGPTIFLSNDVDKIARFALQISNIPDCVMEDLMKIIDHNNNVKDQMDHLEKKLEDAMKENINENDNAKSAEGKEKKINKRMDNMRFNPEVCRLHEKLSELRENIKWCALNDMFIPNRAEHLKRWVPHLSDEEIELMNPFTSHVDPDDVETIMTLSVENIWKILLLMGIGVMTESNSNLQYNEIMKRLAENQCLYLIIASSDYIYGTNYQFCHGYIGRDLSDISQEKIIQALGRIGRTKLQQNYTIRFRDDAHIVKIFQESCNKPEVQNMAKLFTS
jgi:hypothetical protein